jgi:hypothetical protein
MPGFCDYKFSLSMFFMFSYVYSMSLVFNSESKFVARLWYATPSFSICDEVIKAKKLTSIRKRFR